MGEKYILISEIEEQKEEKKKYLDRKKTAKTIGLIGGLSLFVKARMLFDGAYYILPDNLLVNIITLMPEIITLASYAVNDNCNIKIEKIESNIEDLEEKLEQEKLRDIKISVSELCKANEEELKENLQKAELIKLIAEIEENKILKTIKDFDEKSIEEKIEYFKDNSVNDLICISKSYKRERK